MTFFGLDLAQLFLIGTGLIVMLVIAVLMASMYKRCRPNEAMIISGAGAGQNGRAFTIVVGGGAVVLPLVQQQTVISLEVMTLDLESTAPVISKDGIPLFMKGVAQVKVRGDEDSIALAAEHFLGKSDQEIASLAREALIGQIRAVMGTITVDELIQNFDGFAQRIQAIVLPDLAKFGLTVVSFTIAEIKDSVGYLDSLGQRTAEIAKVQAAKEAAISKMENELQLTLIKELDVDTSKRAQMLEEYAFALPILEKSVDQHSSVFTDFLYRYAMIHASGNDFISLGKAEELMQRVKNLKAETTARV